ncbi:putative oxidoreductase/HEAT repeat-containing protein [Methanosarcina barkeri str. Wiesmoor]|uniref:Putative oxidoreductase/HEAT repeat-containing protein n=1 Tax=Methanosarcina barkeri str. Wiesmoor TaxID=1434109 RepID=A0A0E3QPN3_METBA|nr:putative oxidoreductase/HEAT repeat-containing protein [Methanosarcina barkeri str. Wiesmoor]
MGFLTNFLYDSSKKIPGHIFNTSSKVYDKAIKEFSNKSYKLTGIQIDTFFHQENVEKAIEKYLKNPDKIDCSNILIHEFFELFSGEDFSREDADLILNSFFEIMDSEIEKEPELKNDLEFYLAKETYKTTQEMNQGVKKLSKDVKELAHNVQEVHEVINGRRENQSKKESGVYFEESLEKYLNKIIDEDGKTGVSEVYTELSAKEILPVTLKFHDEESNREQEFEVLELVEKEEKLIISGESGSGKTTTFRWLNYILAKSYLEEKNENVPLYIELNSYIGEERFIKNPFDIYIAKKAEEKGISEDVLKTILKGKATILLDGFDLLSPTDEFYPYDKISNFITDYNNCRFVISSRPGFFESIKSSFKVSELEKLTDEKIEIFIDRSVSNEELANTLKDKILSNQQLKSILSNPMMLYIAIKVAMGRKDKSDDLLPSKRSKLYENFIDILFSHQEEKGKGLHADRIQIENSLTDLYFKLQCRNEVSCKYSGALKFVKKSSEDSMFKKISPQLILEDCFKLGILNRNDNYVSYGIHQSFQEYFAAIKLKELFESGFDVSEAFSHPKWEEVVIFTSEMLDSDSIDKFIGSMLLKSELFLASKCVNKASEKVKEKLRALLTEKMDSKCILEKISSIESLGRIGVAGISIISEALKDEDPSVRWSAIKALRNIKSDKAVKPLINALKDEDDDLRWNVAEILGKIKSDTAVKLLINALKDENSHVRLSAAEALGNIKSETAVQLLINALNDENENVQRGAAEALGNIESETAVQPLINALNDENEDVRRSAVEALGKIKSETAVQPLINALKDEDDDLRWNVAEILGKIKSDTAVKLLINALKDENSHVRLSAAEALGNIKSETAVQLLINALNDENEDVRRSAVEALGKIKSETAVQPLINALNDENEDVRRSAVEALGNIKSETAVQPLINALKDENEYVRRSAVEALGNIKSETAVQPLINALKDEDSDVRREAAEALGNIKSETVVQPLINALKDEDSDVRREAAEALGNIKSETAVQPLINALKDEHVRWNGAEALGKICTVKNKKQLEDLLESDHEFSINIAFEILYEIEKEERSKVILFKDEKFLRI